MCHGALSAFSGGRENNVFSSCGFELLNHFPVFIFFFVLFSEPALPIRNYFSQNKLEEPSYPKMLSVIGTCVYFHHGISIFQKFSSFWL